MIGYEKSEQLDVEPAKYFVVVTKREKRACKDCEEQGVARAPGPVRIIEKGLASDRVIIDTVVSKYADYVPLYAGSGLCRVADYAGSNGTAPPDGFFCARHSLQGLRLHKARRKFSSRSPGWKRPGTPLVG